MWASLILAVFIAITIVIAQATLIGAFKKPDKEEDKEEKSKNFLHFLYRRTIRRPLLAAKRYIAAMYAVDRDTWGTALTIGALVGVINYYSSRATVGGIPLVAPFGLAVMACSFVGLGYWWYKAGANWKELIPFVLLALMGFSPAKSAALATSALTAAGFWDSFIKIVPNILLVGTIVFLVAHLWYYKETRTFSKGGEENE